MPHHTKFFEQGVADLQRILKKSLLVCDIAAQLHCCGPDDDAETVRKDMERRRFDIMGYKANDKVIGYVRRGDLRRGPCSQFCNRLVSAQRISETDPILTAFLRLNDKTWLFVEDRNNVTGIITRADLQKAPVRMALFGLVSLLEMHLLSMVQTCYKNDEEVEQALSVDGRRWAEANKDFQRLRRRKEDIGLAETLSLSSKSFLICRQPAVVNFIGFWKPEQGERILKQATDLRNNLAHGHDIIAGTRWEVMIGAVKKIQDVLERYETNRSEFERQFGGRR